MVQRGGASGRTGRRPGPHGAAIGPGGNWLAFLKEGIEAAALEDLRGHERTGRPLGAAAFVADLEARLGRPLAPRKPGRKPKPKDPGNGK